MMTNDDERGGGGKKCPKFDDVICERPLIVFQTLFFLVFIHYLPNK